MGDVTSKIQPLEAKSLSFYSNITQDEERKKEERKKERDGGENQ